MSSIYLFNNYKTYLNERIDTSENKGRGVKKKLAEKLRCQPAFVSQVLSGQPDFSLEQGVLVNDFFNHTENESLCFMTLLQIARAGNSELKKFFTKQLNSIKEKQFSIKDHLNVDNKLDELTKSTYYSSWYYAAVHMLVSIPYFNSIERVAKALDIEIHLVKNVLQFLVDKQIIREQGDHYVMGVANLHLTSDSPLIMRNHNNWRNRAMIAIDKNSQENMHYSLVFTTSEEDLPKIKDVIFKSIKKVHSIFKDSKDEKAMTLVVDLFDLVKKN